MSNLTEKPISELLGLNFFIPSYQRGYRWTERQVEDLLDDINSFTPMPTDIAAKNTWYCLQPIVVKECDEETKIKNNLEGIWYEVIDGQQRLTTIYLIIHYANEMWTGKKKSSEFSVQYETREESHAFLASQKIEDHNDEAEINYDNIDYYHISKAYDKIHNWTKNYPAKFKTAFDDNTFMAKFKFSSKVIWYEVADSKDAIEIFTRINMGKIRLTNSELIKALFLNSSNFNPAEIRLRQLEIAAEWDRIEYTLQNEEFWFFLNETGVIPPTRIDYIFNLIYSMAKENCAELQYRKDHRIADAESIKERKNKEYLTVDEQFGNDEYATFRFFSHKFNLHSSDEMNENWENIKRIFQTIEEWFSDRELYHKIGYLIAAGVPIAKLLKVVKNKTDFRTFLDDEIRNKVAADLDDLEYKNGPVKNVLLHHNIQTMLNFEQETSRFPFNRYKTEKWDIEHIHAIATQVKVRKENQIKWLKCNFVKTEPDLNPLLSAKIESLLQTGITIDEKEFEQIIEYVLGEEDNNIRNLCLLDRGTNRSYKNDSFKEKRRKIIENEKAGIFIPVCTKNVFMKYYSDELADLELWNENDRKSYLKDINKIISQ